MKVSWRAFFVYAPFIIFALALLGSGIIFLFTEIHYYRTSGCDSVRLPYKVTGVFLLIYDFLYVKWFIADSKK